MTTAIGTGIAIETFVGMPATISVAGIPVAAPAHVAAAYYTGGGTLRLMKGYKHRIEAASEECWESVPRAAARLLPVEPVSATAIRYVHGVATGDPRGLGDLYNDYYESPLKEPLEFFTP